MKGLEDKELPQIRGAEEDVVNAVWDPGVGSRTEYGHEWKN